MKTYFCVWTFSIFSQASRTITVSIKCFGCVLYIVFIYHAYIIYFTLIYSCLYIYIFVVSYLFGIFISTFFFHSYILVSILFKIRWMEWKIVRVVWTFYFLFLYNTDKSKFEMLKRLSKQDECININISFFSYLFTYLLLGIIEQ